MTQRDALLTQWVHGNHEPVLRHLEAHGQDVSHIRQWLKATSETEAEMMRTGRQYTTAEYEESQREYAEHSKEIFWMLLDVEKMVP